MPGLSCGKLNRPASSVFTDRLRPFSMFATVTMAPGIAAPAGSVTDPAIALVVSPCAIAGTGANVETRKAASCIRRMRRRDPDLGIPKYKRPDPAASRHGCLTGLGMPTDCFRPFEGTDSVTEPRNPQSRWNEMKGPDGRLRACGGKGILKFSAT